MRTIADIIEDWKVECGTVRTGKNGPYRSIPFTERKGLFFSLIQTMIDEGYGEEDITSLSTRNLVCNTCALPDFANITPKKNKQIKEIASKDWKEVLREFYHGSISKYVPEDRAGKYVPEVKQEAVEAAKALPTTEEEMKEMADLPNKLKNDPTRTKPQISEDVEELDTDFLEFMGLPIPDGNSNE